MRRLRIYLTSTVAGLAGAVAVVAISSRLEGQRMEQYMEHMRNAPVPADFQGGVVGGSEFGPGLFTFFLAALVFAAVSYCLLRWQRRSS